MDRPTGTYTCSTNSYYHVNDLNPTFINKNNTVSRHLFRSKAVVHILDEYVHREDGPAVKYAYDEFWMQRGCYHREDGPAIIASGDAEIYFIDGVCINDQVKIWMKEYNIPTKFRKWTDEYKVLFKMQFG